MTATQILMVEDEEHLSSTLSFILEAEDYEVAVAEDLTGARARVAEQQWELIILDVMLGEENGFDLLEEMRERDDHTPVLMLTARADTPDVVAGLGLGADDYLGKPFEVDELLVRVAALLRRSRWQRSRAPDETIVFGGNRVDARSGLAQTATGQQRLTDQELKLLRFFAAHPHEELSRQRLLEAVWDLPAGSAARSRSLDTFMMRLRKHFEADPADPEFFRTVYGVGYRFTP